MKKSFFSVLQRIGKSLMLPVSVLPAAGLLLRLGQPDLLNIPYVEAAGNAIFSNLPMIFAVGVAIGFSGGEAVAALAAVIGQLILQAIQTLASTTAAASMAKTAAASHHMTLKAFMTTQEYSNIVTKTTVNMSVFGGIIIGITAAILYNKFHNIKLPQVLGFFAGKRFIPIISSVAAVIIGIIGVNIWLPVQGWINDFANFASSSSLGPGMYAAGKRLLIPVGLHHIYYPVFLYQFGHYVSNGVTYIGDTARYFHGDPTAGHFMASEYPILMFGLPGAATAIIATAKKEKRKLIAGMMVSSAFVAFVTGITEPIEYSFIFVAPVLFIFHVLAAFSAGIVTSLLNIRLGYTFSASFIDYVLGFKYAGNRWLIWPVGIAYFALYFIVFYFSIRAFNIKTPGREDEDTTAVKPINAQGSEKAVRVLEAIGGKDNIKVLDACITRLRLNLKDTSLVDDSTLKALGAAGVMKAGDSVQVVFGTQAERIKDDIKTIIANGGIIETSNEEKAEPIKEVETKSGIHQLLSPLDGEIIPIEQVPDEVFAQKIAGDGFGIIPSGEEIVSPVDGELSVVFPTKHAFAITTDDGLEVMVHIGIDTVKLKGEGFTTHIEQGSRVRKGDKVVTMDSNLIKERGKSTVTVVLVTNMDAVEGINVETGKAVKGQKVADVKIK
ncbi:glucose PTS transporter subunit IIA [Clostridium oryzae]|uniref:PTS system glucose-specific EIICBA component n=1 Tax=Clostridium oryzae TaxID=1450648 RepID=A0A1V4IVZ7_9CLOT|nr:glucose PTS transporter subunit IIA [Clostridium oryzae]OPJ64126.1 PTS system glucose-specific EIICBA component [Clostridium oryzae]